MSRKELKVELKSLAEKIRETKTELKKYQKENGGCDGGFYMPLYRLRYEYRHKHIAYCQLRGRTYEEIESKSTRNSPDFTYIKEIMDANREIPQDVRACA